MNVRSMPLGEPPREPSSGKASAVPTRRSETTWPIGLFMLVIGIPLWVWGAKYSLDGWVVALNIFFADIVEIQTQLPLATGRLVLILFPLGFLYSFVEVKLRPWHYSHKGALFVIAVFFAFIIAHGTDVGSTLLAVLTPQPDAWPITHWLARTWIVAGLWSIVLTYVPEALILGGMYFIRGKR